MMLGCRLRRAHRAIALFSQRTHSSHAEAEALVARLYARELLKNCTFSAEWTSFVAPISFVLACCTVLAAEQATYWAVQVQMKARSHGC